MSSAVLYLAIVAVWGLFLVPMWLHRDGDGITSRLRHRRAEAEEPLLDEDLSAEPMAEPDAEAVLVRPVRRRRNSRAAVIARRRRRTLGVSLLFAASIGTVLGGAAPWWFVLPSFVLFAAHIALLRVAAQMDAERREERRRAAIRAARAARRAREERAVREAREAAIRPAEVIEMPGRPQEEVYDQYTDRRAVGD